MLTTEDLAEAAESERYALEVAARGRRPGGALDQDLRRELVTAIAERDARTVMTTVEPTVAERHEGIDISHLESVGDELSAAFLVDLQRSRQPA